MSIVDWRSMKSAPKDGTPVLLWHDDADRPYLVVGYWCDKGYEPGLCWKVVGGHELPATPDNWAPLPEPSEAQP